MIPRAKTPNAVDAASGGDRDFLAGAERADHTPPPGSVIRPRYWLQELWLRQVAVAGPSRSADRASKWRRQGPLSFDDGAHLWIDRFANRGTDRPHHYAVILREDLV